MTIRIILADDHTLIRECVCAILTKSSDFEVLAETDNGKDVVRLACDLLPDVVLMDIGMKEVNGIEATRRIAAKCPDVKVLILSMHAEKRYVVEGLNAGANGFLLKSSLSREMTAAIRTVAANGYYISPALELTIGENYQRRPSAQLSLTPLTPREREVLVMLAEGKTSKEIASMMQISVKTVETHRMHVMKKLNLNNIADLTKHAIRAGLILLD